MHVARNDERVRQDVSLGAACTIDPQPQEQRPRHCVEMSRKICRTDFCLFRVRIREALMGSSAGKHCWEVRMGSEIGKHEWEANLGNDTGQQYRTLWGSQGTR